MNLNRVSKGFWIWGGFLDEETKYLKEIQKQVHSKLPSPSFDMHITLAGPYFFIDLNFKKSIKSFCKNNSLFKIELCEYKYKQENFQSFFIRVKKDNNLIDLRNYLFNLKSFKNQSVFYPHISLSYGKHEILEKKKLVSNLPILRNYLNLNKLFIVKVDENKKQWQILDTLFLSK